MFSEKTSVDEKVSQDFLRSKLGDSYQLFLESIRIANLESSSPEFKPAFTEALLKNIYHLFVIQNFDEAMLNIGGAIDKTLNNFKLVISKNSDNYRLLSLLHRLAQEYIGFFSSVDTEVHRHRTITIERETWKRLVELATEIRTSIFLVIDEKTIPIKTFFKGQEDLIDWFREIKIPFTLSESQRQEFFSFMATNPNPQEFLSCLNKYGFEFKSTKEEARQLDIIKKIKSQLYLREISNEVFKKILQNAIQTLPNLFIHAAGYNLASITRFSSLLAGQAPHGTTTEIISALNQAYQANNLEYVKYYLRALGCDDTAVSFIERQIEQQKRISSSLATPAAVLKQAAMLAMLVDSEYPRPRDKGTPEVTFPHPKPSSISSTIASQIYSEEAAAASPLPLSPPPPPPLPPLRDKNPTKLSTSRSRPPQERKEESKPGLDLSQIAQAAAARQRQTTDIPIEDRLAASRKKATEEREAAAEKQPSLFGELLKAPVEWKTKSRTASESKEKAVPKSDGLINLRYRINHATMRLDTAIQNITTTQRSLNKARTERDECDRWIKKYESRQSKPGENASELKNAIQTQQKRLDELTPKLLIAERIYNETVAEQETAKKNLAKLTEELTKAEAQQRSPSPISPAPSASSPDSPAPSPPKK